MPFSTAAVTVTAAATLIFDPAAHGNKGNFHQPQLILIQNQDASDYVAVGGSDVTYAAAPRIAPGGNLQVRIEAGEPIYGICDTAASATVCYIVTRA